MVNPLCLYNVWHRWCATPENNTGVSCLRCVKLNAIFQIKHGTFWRNYTQTIGNINNRSLGGPSLSLWPQLGVSCSAEIFFQLAQHVHVWRRHRSIGFLSFGFPCRNYAGQRRCWEADGSAQATPDFCLGQAFCTRHCLVYFSLDVGQSLLISVGCGFLETRPAEQREAAVPCLAAVLRFQPSTHRCKSCFGFTLN